MVESLLSAADSCNLHHILKKFASLLAKRHHLLEVIVWLLDRLFFHRILRIYDNSACLGHLIRYDSESGTIFLNLVLRVVLDDIVGLQECKAG